MGLKGCCLAAESAIAFPSDNRFVESLVRGARLTKGRSGVEVSESLNMGNLGPLPIAADKIFKILLNLKVKDFILRPLSTIVQSLLGPGHVIKENLMFGLNVRADT